MFLSGLFAKLDRYGRALATAFVGTVATVADAATITIDGSKGQDFQVLLTSAVGATRTVAFTNFAAEQKALIYMTQPASGGPCSVSNWSGALRPGGTNPNFSTAANATDTFAVRSHAGNMYLDLVGQAYS